jgi:BlaI family transcriptional regulator, penicillinase repressor
VSPDGPLTPTQYEILEAVWNAGVDGITVAEIWQQVTERRQVARTTILNLVDRLEKRGWLRRKAVEGVNRFTAAVSRDRTHASLAGDFVDDFFGGSASHLMMSLLGTGRLSPDEVRELRTLLDNRRDPGRKEGAR